MSLLDQVISCSDGTVIHEHVIDILGVVDREVVFKITSAIIEKDIPETLEILDEVYGRGHDLKKFYADLIEHVRNLMVVKTGKRISRLVDVPAREIDRMTEQAKHISGTYLSQILDILFKEEPGIRFSSNPRVAMEMTCIKMAQIKPALPIETLIEKLDTLKKKTDFKKDRPPESVTGTPAVETKAEKDQKVQDSQSNQSSHDDQINHDNQSNKGNKAHMDSEEVWKVVKEKISGKYPSLTVPLSKTRFEQEGESDILLEITGTGFDVKMVERKKNDIESVVKEVLQKPITINIKSNINHDNRTEIDRASRLKEGAINNPLVAEAVAIFDGRIVDIKIL